MDDKSGKYNSDAEGCFKHALMLNRSYAHAHRSLARLDFEHGRLESCVVHIERALRPVQPKRPAPWFLQRALLTPRVTPGSHHRCAKRT